jgi:hypothetical protein
MRKRANRDLGDRMHFRHDVVVASSSTLGSDGLGTVRVEAYHVRKSPPNLRIIYGFSDTLRGL